LPISRDASPAVYEYVAERYPLAVAKPAKPARAKPDGMTGLPARHASLAELETRIAAGEDAHCLVIDIDGFERLNAHLGSEIADEILIGLGKTLAQTLPDVFIGRLAGDQFIAISERELTSLERNTLTALEVETPTGIHALQLSAGVASTQISGNDADDVLRDALAALRVAKQQGKQRVVEATPQLREIERGQRRIALDARSALENNEIEAWAQPIFDLTTDKPAGFELLARWPREDGFESPGLFVPVIESLGFSFQLGEFMVREAASLLSRLADEGHPETFVTINVSAKHVAEPLLPSLIALQLERRSIEPHRMIVELTESQRLPDSRAGRTAVERLRALGIGVASDDVGAGWSSLTQMIKSRFTHIKTDRDLIQATALPGGFELIQAIRLLAEGASQIAIAEGIETAEELAAVRRAGFTLGQGWHLQKPAPQEASILSL